MSILTIRRPSKREKLEILSEERICSKLDAKPGVIIKDKSISFALVIWEKNKMLVSYKKVGNDVVDCHLACPTKSLRAARVLTLIGMQWLLTDSNISVNTLTTSTLKGTMSNFAKKVGFIKIDSDENKDYFVYTNTNI